MDESAFDRLTRAVSTTGSRRRLLRLFAGMSLGEILTSQDGEAVQATCPHGGDHRRNRGKHKHKRHRNGKRDNGTDGSGLPCAATCGGCCNGTICVPFNEVSNQACGVNGVTCVACPEMFFCDAGNCVCFNPGEVCNPSVQPDQCCAFASSVCSTGPNQAPGICCLQDGMPCLPTAGTACMPGSGCCCSGVCGGGNTCVPSSSS